MLSINTINLDHHSSVAKKGFFGRLWSKFKNKIITAVATFTLGPIGGAVAALLTAWLDKHNSRAVNTKGMGSIATTLTQRDELQLSAWMDKFNPVAKKIIEKVDGVLPSVFNRDGYSIQHKIDKINEVSRLTNLIMEWGKNQATYLEVGWSDAASNARLEYIEIFMDSIQKAIQDYMVKNDLSHLTGVNYTELFSNTKQVESLVLNWKGQVTGSYVFYKELPTFENDHINNNTGTTTQTTVGDQQTGTTTNNNQQQSTENKSASSIWKWIGFGGLIFGTAYAMGKSKKSSK